MSFIVLAATVDKDLCCLNTAEAILDAVVVTVLIDLMIYGLNYGLFLSDRIADQKRVFLTSGKMEDLKSSSEEQNIVLSNGSKTIVEPHEEMLKRDEETSKLSAGAPEFLGSMTHLPSAQSDQVSEDAVGVTAELKR